MFELPLSKLAKALDKQDIEYMIIGGQALLLYGEPRLTKDIEATLGIEPGQVDLLIGVLDSLNLKPLVENVRDFVTQTWVVPALEETSGIRVDFMFSLSGYEKQAMRRFTVKNILGYPVKFASKEDLIIHKIIAGRPQDLEDVKSIIRKQVIDKEYVQHWIKAFDESLGESFENILETIYRETEND